MLSTDDDIVYENCDYSYNELQCVMDELSDEAINNFKENVCDSDAIVFEQGNGPAQLEVNVNAGSLISTDSATASVGYRVKRNVTASWR